MWALYSVLINAIWVIGLSALLAVLSYLDWYRSTRRWSIRQTLCRPLALVPIYTSLSIFCSGLSLGTAFYSSPIVSAPVSIVGPLVWALITLFFIYQTVLAGLSGKRNGWDRPIDV